MIKNKAQLVRAEERLVELRNRLIGFEKQYEGEDRDLRLEPLHDQIQEITNEIQEYRNLSTLTLAQAIQGPLDKGVLIENIGELLAKLRIAAGLTQSELAERLGWDQPNVSRFESATYSGQSIAKIAEYLDAIGVWLHVRPSLTEVPIVIKYTNTPQTASGAVDMISHGPSFVKTQSGTVFSTGLLSGLVSSGTHSSASTASDM